MSPKNRLLLISVVGLIVLFTAFLYWGWPYFIKPHIYKTQTDGFGSNIVLGQVTKVIETGELDLGGIKQPYQVLQVKMLEGAYKAITLEVEYGKYQQRPGLRTFSLGDQMYVRIEKTPDNVLKGYYVDRDRSAALWLLLGIFVIAIIAMGRRKGIGAILSLAFSFAVIVGYIVPHILDGENPVVVSLIGSAILLGVTLYLTYGWHIKTHSAVISMVISLILTGVLSYLFVEFGRLSGFGDENALFLIQVSSNEINLKGLLLGGMIIGALGVLDDLVTSQTAVAFELYSVDNSLSLRELFFRSMRIGQDHIAATVNTLFLAYTGSSLPLLLLFALGNGNIPYLINAEFVTEEVVRTLVGSIGLIMAVPIASFVASFTVRNSHLLGEWIHLLGIEKEDGFHHH